MLEKTMGCQLINLPVHADQRGNLCVLQYDHWVPFKPERTYWVWGVPEGVLRGAHAHRESSQIHICLNGVAQIFADDGKTRQTFILDTPNKGLFVGPMIWAGFKLSSPNACLVVISSHTYSEEDYVKDYEEFLNIVRKETR